MKTIIFTEKSSSITPAGIERKFQREKNQDNLLITNKDLLNRFRIAVLVGEIEPFKLIIKETKNTYNDIWTKNWFKTADAYNSKWFCEDEKEFESYFNISLRSYIKYGPSKPDPGERGYKN